jgi:hypothetical protein
MLRKRLRVRPLELQINSKNERLEPHSCHTEKDPIQSHQGYPLNMQNMPSLPGKYYEINSLTRAFSSFNSATDASIFARLKSFIESPCTISHFPPRTRTGNDEINPFSTP